MSKEPHTFDFRDLPPDKTRRLRFGPVGVALWFIVGLLGLVLSGFFYWIGVEQSHWVAAQAKAVDGWIWTRGRNTTYYVVALKYQYDVDGTAYTGECEMHPSYATKTLARDALEHFYTDGQTFIVYYDPGDPSQSTKDRTEASDKATAFLVGGAIFVLSALWIRAAEKRYWGSSWGK